MKPLNFLAPIAPPVQEWKTIMDEANARTRKLEEDYEATCVENKVKLLFFEIKVDVQATKTHSLTHFIAMRQTGHLKRNYTSILVNNRNQWRLDSYLNQWTK